MLQLELTILVVASILGIINEKNRIGNFLKAIGCVICLILFVFWFRHGRIMPIITTIALIFIGLIIGECIKTKEFSVILIFLLFALVVLYLNRGIFTRFYDPSGQFSFVERYNMNYQLRYEGNLPEGIKLYILTQNLDGNMIKENKIIEKLNKKIEYYLVCMNYDQEGNYIGTGYSYKSPYTYESLPGSLRPYESRITAKVQTDKMSEAIQYIKKCVSNTFDDGYYDLDDEYYGYENDYSDNSDPGVHWVDEYDRQDGTHVDGYLRTDPDGDPTNNFSYQD